MALARLAQGAYNLIDAWSNAEFVSSKVRDTNDIASIALAPWLWVVVLVVGFVGLILVGTVAAGAPAQSSPPPPAPPEPAGAWIEPEPRPLRPLDPRAEPIDYLGARWVHRRNQSDGTPRADPECPTHRTDLKWVERRSGPVAPTHPGGHTLGLDNGDWWCDDPRHGRIEVYTVQSFGAARAAVENRMVAQLRLGGLIS